MQSHSPEEIAKAISGQFKETDEKTLVMLVTRYYEQDTWKDNLIFEEASLTLLQDILEEAGELENESLTRQLLRLSMLRKH